MQSDDCHIRPLSKPREGRSRYWCLSHDASATARFGVRMSRCEGAYRTLVNYRRFQFNPAEFPGGVSLRGAIKPVYNTSGEPAERGIYVHAGDRADGTIAIDQIFDAVEMPVRRDLYNDERVLITADTAVAFYISRLIGRTVVGLFCPKCNTPHLDSDWYAVKPHRVHLCHGCNRLFRQEARRVSNPLEMIRHQLGIGNSGNRLIRATRDLEIRQVDYPGGLQIWASSPALLCIPPRREQDGIRIRGWHRPGVAPRLNGTFRHVRIDGLDLDEEQLRIFMAQNALVYLKGKVVALDCPSCGSAVFDQGEAAFRPKNERRCASCGIAFTTKNRRKVVSNPFVATINALRLSIAKGGKTT